MLVSRLFYFFLVRTLEFMKYIKEAQLTWFAQICGGLSLPLAILPISTLQCCSLSDIFFSNLLILFTIGVVTAVLNFY